MNLEGPLKNWPWQISLSKINRAVTTVVTRLEVTCMVKKMKIKQENPGQSTAFCKFLLVGSQLSQKRDGGTEAEPSTEFCLS